MMRRIFLLLTLTVLGAKAEAILPPLYESIKEYQALLLSPELDKKLHSGEMIEKIERSDNSFLIETNQHMLKVSIIYEPAKHPGPAIFHFVFSDPVNK